MSNKSKICAPGEKMLIDGVWYQRVGVLDFSLVECDPPKTNESSKRIDGNWYRKERETDECTNGTIWIACDQPQPETPAVEECAGCRYWRDHGNIGDCRRTPPVQGDAVTVALFPRTNRDSWCGEWMPK